METCLVTGVTGQDGAYLVELLLKRGCSVWGSYRRTSSDNFWRLRELGVFGHQHLQLVECDLTDLGAVITMVEKVQPQKIFNLAAQSFVAVSFAQPHSTAQVTALGALNVLEAIRILDRKIKFYQASTSEMFGKVVEVPQSENTPFYPRSPYGVAKLYAHWITVNYRESYGIFASSGILFNHESPLRGKEFVTRKITDGVAKIKLGMLDSLELGNLDARRDWGFAGDYVDGMDRMLAASEPDTFVLATNRTTSIRDFLRMAFRHAEIDIDFIGAGPNEEAINLKTGSTVARVNPRFYRPAEVDLLIGDFSKAKRNLSWEPVMQLEELCGAMFSSDLRRNQVGSPF